MSERDEHGVCKHGAPYWCPECEIKHLRARIAELEQTLENVLHGRREFIDRFKEKPVLITAERIDAAWGKAIAETRSKRETTYTFQALRALGITACEACEGSDSMEWGEGAMVCAACNGHRWVWKEASDE
jgi:hypothetical protein